MKNKIQNRGFTLIEILIVVAIIAILATVGIPYMSNVLARLEARKVESIINTLTTHSKQQSYLHHQRISLCGSQDGSSCNPNRWSKSIIVFHDNQNKNRVRDTNERILQTINLELKYGTLTWSGAGRSVVNNPTFQPDSGLPRGSNGTFRYCSYEHANHFAMIMSDMGHVRANRQITC